MLQIDPTSLWAGLAIGLLLGIFGTALTFTLLILQGYKEQIDLLRYAVIKAGDEEGGLALWPDGDQGDGDDDTDDDIEDDNGLGIGLEEEEKAPATRRRGRPRKV